MQGVENYNSTDGSTYYQVNDALLQKGRQAAAKGSSSSSSRLAVPALFKAAAAGNWTLQQWIAASTTGSDVSKWRLLLTWPFGEEGGIFRFNKEGTGLYGLTSIGR